MKAEKLYWYFSDEKKRLRFDDGRKIKLGVTHKVKCKPVLCESGLHASIKILDTLNYAPGNIVWRVKLGGDIVCGDDKAVATERKYVSGGIDISDVLRKFACMCALDVIHLWDAPPVVIKYLKTRDESLRDAARTAARAAARDAVGDAARAAARAAARDVARDAARATARGAVRAAARDAAWDAARATAGNAAGDVVRDAAWEKQNRRLTQMVIRKLRGQT